MRNMVILLSLVTIILFSCNAQKDEDKIVGKWKIIEFSANTPSLAPELISGAKAESLSRTYVYKKDHTFIVKSNFIPDGEQGIWEITTEKKTIKMTYPTGSRQSQEIYLLDALSSNTMKWTQDFKERGSISLVLEKE